MFCDLQDVPYPLQRQTDVPSSAAAALVPAAVRRLLVGAAEPPPLGLSVTEALLQANENSYKN